MHLARGSARAASATPRSASSALASRTLEGHVRTRPIEETSLREELHQLALADQILSAIPGREEISIQLYRAGVPMTPVQRFLTVSVGDVPVAGLAVGCWRWRLARRTRPALRLLAGAAAAGCRCGDRSAARMRLFEQQLPDALDLLVRSLRAGHSLTFGLQMVGDELSEPIGTGVPLRGERDRASARRRKSALDNLLYRIPSARPALLRDGRSPSSRRPAPTWPRCSNNLATVIRERFKVLRQGPSHHGHGPHVGEHPGRVAAGHDRGHLPGEPLLHRAPVDRGCGPDDRDRRPRS